MPTKTLGGIISSAGMEIGEPVITEFTTTNIFQVRMIEEANNAVRDLVDRLDYKWTLQRTTLSTNADITTEYAAVTNGSTTVNSVDEDGNSADNWGSVAAGMVFRVTATYKSYLIDSVDTSSSPDTLEIETNYLDSTSTASGYRIFQDTYAVSTTNFAELASASYGDSVWAGELVVVPLARQIQLAGGDRHIDTSGRPKYISQIGVDSSNNPQFVFWPFPDDTFLFELWYSTEFSTASAFSTVLFGEDAPSSAYDYVEHKVVSAAQLWDERADKAAVFEQKAQSALSNCIRLENRGNLDVGMEVASYRRRGAHIRGRSERAFDTVRRRWR